MSAPFIYTVVIAFLRLCRFVFANYTWSDDGSQYTHSFGRMIPSQIPYTALIRGTVLVYFPLHL